MPPRGPSSELPAVDLHRVVLLRKIWSTDMHVGWDWGNTTHAVAVIDDQGHTIDRWASPHTEDGLEATLTRLASHAAPADLPRATTRDCATARCAPGRPRPPTRLERRAAPLGRGLREGRPRRRLHARRLPPHRRAPPAHTASRRAGDPRSASARACPRGQGHRS